ncbi:hypothetical protein WJU23_18880 [Prosthecobacter sp. SYSU 5D2]|uniref:hypothetical protein n=1 Tax=Prosthecobacter sp. SYSU 5D2 TaxID=3134134 RepID=UPI0031FE636D
MDQISKQAAESKSLGEKVGTTLLKPIRVPLGMAANHVAKGEMLESFVANTNLPAPAVWDTDLKNAQGDKVRDINNKVVQDTRQFEISKLDFKPKGGSSQSVEGWVMPAQPGNPTVVFFGGSDFDRSKQSYQDAIKTMAYEAKERGMGFAVFDYPDGVNEKTARQYVNQLQQHLADQGIPLDQQAYSGYSQGSFAATYAAQSNVNAAGLQITSGFSSGRMAQKDKMQEILDENNIGPLSSLIEKRQFTEVWDNIPLAEEIGTRRAQQQADGTPVMPIAAVYDDQELFGQDGNRHMTPLIAALSNNDPTFQARITSGKDHLEMLGTSAQLASFQNFAQEAKNFANNPNRQLLEQVVQVDVAVEAPKTSVRDMLKTAASSLKNTIKEKLGLDDQSKLERMEKQLAKRENHGADLEKRKADVDRALADPNVAAALNKKYDVDKHLTGTGPERAEQMEIKEAQALKKASDKLGDRIDKNEDKAQELKDKIGAHQTKMEMKAARQQNQQNVGVAGGVRV